MVRAAQPSRHLALLLDGNVGRLLRTVLLGSALVFPCCRGDEPQATLRSTPEVPSAAPGTPLRGSLSLAPGRALAPGSWIRFDQGYVEDGRELFGAELRYRLPDLERDVAGMAASLSARLEADGRSQPLAVAVLPLAQGWFAVPLKDGAPEGAVLRVELGGERTGGVAPLAPTVPLELELHAYLESASSSERVPQCVPVRVAASGADWLRVLAPAQAAPGAAIELRVLWMSGASGPRSSSHVVAPAGDEVEVELDGRWVSFRGALPPPDRPGGIAFEVPGRAPGLYRFAVRSPSSPRLSGRSPPVRVSATREDACFFGSLHNHTVVGGHAASTPRRTIAYARDVSRLDFLGFSEHAEAPTFDWQQLGTLVEEATEEGRFVCFAGYEWTHPTDGHRNIVVKDAARSPLVSTRPRPDAQIAGSLEELAATAGTDPNVLVIVHHPLWSAPGVQTGYRYVPGAAIPRQRLAEAYSWHGCSLGGPTPYPLHDDPESRQAGPEFSILAALSAGTQLFLVADGDSHLGRPGGLEGVDWVRSRRYSYLGITAVHAPALTREDVFRALEQGRVYGTTGARLLLDARRSETGVDVEVHATAPLHRIALRSPGETVAARDFEAVEPQDPVLRQWDTSSGTWDPAVHFDLQHPGPLVLEITQQDGHQAWKLLPEP